MSKPCGDAAYIWLLNFIRISRNVMRLPHWCISNFARDVAADAYSKEQKSQRDALRNAPLVQDVSPRVRGTTPLPSYLKYRQLPTSRQKIDEHRRASAPRGARQPDPSGMPPRRSGEWSPKEWGESDRRHGTARESLVIPERPRAGA